MCNLNIHVEPLSEQDMKPVFDNPEQLDFGTVFTDRMFTMKYNTERGWHDAKIEKYRPILLEPASAVLHYAQEIFEGLKAYISKDGRILMFRPEENAKRMNRSAKRMCMPEIPVEDFVQAIKELVMLEKRWIPKEKGTALYIRPTMIATEPVLGVHPSKEYLFFIILSPVGPYFKSGFSPVSIYVEDKLVRAVPGGVGDVKTGGNYAASLYASVKAKEKGFSQVLWLDGKEHRYIEEVGAMNIFFVYGNKIVTPALNGSILPGITRKSVLELAPVLGYDAEERLISIDEVLQGIENGKITEVFGTGTAALIAPIDSLYYKGRSYIVKNKVGEVTKVIYNDLVNIQYGEAEDEYGWVYELGEL